MSLYYLLILDVSCDRGGYGGNVEDLRKGLCWLKTNEMKVECLCWLPFFFFFFLQIREKSYVFFFFWFEKGRVVCDFQIWEKSGVFFFWFEKGRVFCDFQIWEKSGVFISNLRKGGFFVIFKSKKRRVVAFMSLLLPSSRWWLPMCWHHWLGRESCCCS